MQLTVQLAREGVVRLRPVERDREHRALTARQHRRHGRRLTQVVRGMPARDGRVGHRTASAAGARPSSRRSSAFPFLAAARIVRATSTTWHASSPDARCGRPSASDSRDRARPMPRASRPPRDAIGTSSQPCRPRAQANRPVEGVRVGKREHAVGAVDHEVAHVLARSLEARDEVRGDAALELQRRRRVGRSLGA